ncbi:hypothetical protein [Egicoccus halophilus]|uniref:Uncharacterized protein n=1 Tax=Egicoccus halophilus TaxID=1670830 RepID=A0A8J3ETP1_9ACTN|nr:hypothetical protein [Egicoccus halophilus]GGI05558.1 hypothetical protein GCM10011354_14700 [Egicoccus halophilus]
MLIPSSSSPPPTAADLDALELTGCVVCGDDSAVGTVCSRSCAAAAQHQIAANVAELHRLPRNSASRSRRQFLTARNGRLTDAMLAWRPDVAPGSEQAASAQFAEK